MIFSDRLASIKAELLMEGKEISAESIYLKCKDRDILLEYIVQENADCRQLDALTAP